MGRSRGGLTNKIHALVDAMGLPIVLKLTPGQAHDGRSAEDMCATVRAGTVLLADRAYDSNALRERIAERGARANIRAMPNRVKPPPHVTTNEMITILLPSNSLHCEYGCGLMSR